MCVLCNPYGHWLSESVRQARDAAHLAAAADVERLIAENQALEREYYAEQGLSMKF
jgi:hypothetical protein